MNSTMDPKNLTDADFIALEELSDYLTTLQNQIIAAAEYDQIRDYLDTCMYKRDEIITSAEQVPFYDGEYDQTRDTGGSPTCRAYSKFHSKYDQAWCIIERLANKALATLEYSIDEGFLGLTEDNIDRLLRVLDKLCEGEVDIRCVFDKPSDT